MIIPECEARVFYISRRLVLLCSRVVLRRFSELSKTNPEFVEFLEYLEFAEFVEFAEFPEFVGVRLRELECSWSSGCANPQPGL